MPDSSAHHFTHDLTGYLFPDVARYYDDVEDITDIRVPAIENPFHPPVDPDLSTLDDPEDIELLGKVIGQAVYWDLTDTLEMTLYQYVRNDTGTAAFMDHVDGQDLRINFRTGKASRRNWEEDEEGDYVPVVAMWTVFSGSPLDLEAIL